MSSTIKLLPCPFCSNAEIAIKNENPKDNSGGYFIECPGCGASTSLRFACGDDPSTLLAEQWNRRTVSHRLHQIQEPATGLQLLIAEIDQHMRAEWDARRLPAECWPTDLARRVRDAAAGTASAQAGSVSLCTCPSGDGSLRWPCPAHPPAADAPPSFPAMTEELASILGLMCFQCIRFAQALRAGGYSINKRAEDEQAAVLHWMLGHYFRSGPEGWRAAASADMERLAAQRAAPAAQEKE